MMLLTLMPVSETVQDVLEVEGESDLLSSDELSGVAESVISGKIRVGISHPHYW